jgi:hypothetical protein
MRKNKALDNVKMEATENTVLETNSLQELLVVQPKGKFPKFWGYSGLPLSSSFPRKRV